MLCYRRRLLKWACLLVPSLVCFYILMPAPDMTVVKSNVMYMDQKTTKKLTTANATTVKVTTKAPAPVKMKFPYRINPHLHRHPPPSNITIPWVDWSAKYGQDYSQKTEDEARLSQRQSKLKDFCSTRGAPSGKSLSFLNHKVPIVSPKVAFLHCPVTKSASTFWSRFVDKMPLAGPMGSPFDLKLDGKVNIPKTLFAAVANTNEGRAKFLQKAVKSVFVREPYSRMFSAYVDKVFAPNPYYWKEWGKRRKLSKPPGPRERLQPKCTHDLTFAEVMSFAAAHFHKTDLHFIPVTTWCLPCDFKYDVVGKMETFTQDLRYISRHFNLSRTDYFASKEFLHDYTRDAIEDSVYSPFGWTKHIKRCMPKMEMGQRVWRKLQIRGFIDRRIALPYTAQSFRDVTADQMIQAALEAAGNSTDRARLKQQKKDALVEAYRTVDISALQKIKQVFMDDFNVFGYDPAPPELFERTKQWNATGAFDWSKPWQG